jgi:PAS domain S-box-containing protein
LRDVTERKRIERALRDSQLRLALVLDATSEGVWDWNVVTGVVYYSPRWLETLGYRSDDMRPTIAFREGLIHPDDLPRVREQLQQHLLGRTPHDSCDIRVRASDCTWRWMLERGKVVEWDEVGQPTRVVGANTDISERKQAEAALQSSEERYRTLVDNLPIGVYRTTPGPRGRFLVANPALARMVRLASAGGPVLGHHVAYHLAPRFNAAGRMEDARIVLDLLLERDPARAAALLGRLDRLNAERKALQALAYEEASAQALKRAGRVVFAFSPSWHRGVLGPVAARLAETHRRSSFVVGLSGGTGTGSVRAFGADNVMDLLLPARHLLERFGGHAGAAGFSVREERIAELQVLLESAPPAPDGPESPSSYIPLLKEELSELWEAWRLLDPFGPGNEEPVLGLEGIRARGSRVIKERHILWDVLDEEGKTLSVIAWDGIPRGLSPSSLTPSALLLVRPSPENRRKTPYPFYLNLLDIG